MLNAQVRDLTPAEKTLFAKEISMRMKDPDSFDFDKIDLRLISTGDTFDPADGLCEQFGYNRFSMPSA